MKPQSMKARKASENSNNNDATCFNFNELLVALDAIDAKVEIPIGSGSAYDFTSLSKALSVAEKDDKSIKEATLKTRDEPCQSFTSFSKGLIPAEVDNKIRDACLMVRTVIRMKLRDEYGCDITSLLKAKEASRKFLNEILKIRNESHREITSLSKGLTVAEVDSRIEEEVLNFCRETISLRTLLCLPAGHNKASEAKLKFQKALKVRDESCCQNHAVRRFRCIFGDYHWELGMAKRRHLKQQRTKFLMFFA